MKCTESGSSVMDTQESEVLSQEQEEICIMGERFAVVDRSALMIADIVGRVSIFHRIPVPVLREKTKCGAYVSRSRQEAMWLCSKLTDRSSSIIGREFGGRDHSSVYYCLGAMEDCIRQGTVEAEDLIVMLGDFPNVQCLGTMH